MAFAITSKSRNAGISLLLCTWILFTCLQSWAFCKRSIFSFRICQELERNSTACCCFIRIVLKRILELWKRGGTHASMQEACLIEDAEVRSPWPTDRKCIGSRGLLVRVVGLDPFANVSACGLTFVDVVTSRLTCKQWRYERQDVRASWHSGAEETEHKEMRN